MKLSDSVMPASTASIGIALMAFTLPQAAVPQPMRATFPSQYPLAPKPT